MPTADLYIRVSTDEQAVKGFSQRSQEERLRGYCTQHKINIFSVIVEDYSAKTFNRPAWKQRMQQWIHSKLNRPDLLLFTHWNRFSRNIGDAYYIIQKLNHLHIQPQAIEQPLNLEVPENKIMLAMYLAASEVENDRRAINIKQGIRKAKKEGRWTGPAPMGYVNRVTETGLKYIALHDPEAMIIKRIFLQMAKGNHSIRQMHKIAQMAGLKCSLNNFCCLVHNPVYCGKIKVPSFEYEKEYTIKGSHEQLVTEELFNEVQTILKSRRKKTSIQNRINKHLPLRGFLLCPSCGKTLTGSTSKGKTNYYQYYHCSNGCKFRARADHINQQFILEIKNLHPARVYLDLYSAILQHIYKDQFKVQSINQYHTTKSIEGLLDRVVKARELLFVGEIDPDDYIAIKSDCEKKINLIGLELQHTADAVLHSTRNLNKEIVKLSQLGLLYECSNIEIKRKLITILLPNKVVLNIATNNIISDRTLSTIFNLHKEPALYQNNETEILTEPLNLTNKHELYYEAICKIIAFEKEKGKVITQEQLQKMIFFMEQFAHIALTL